MGAGSYLRGMKRSQNLIDLMAADTAKYCTSQNHSLENANLTSVKKMN